MELKVCVGSACHLKGSSEVVRTFQTLIRQHSLEEKLKLKGSFCVGSCDQGAVAVEFNKKIYSTTPEDAEGFFNKTVLPNCKAAVKK